MVSRARSGRVGQQIRWQGTSYGALNWQLNPAKVLPELLKYKFDLAEAVTSLQGRVLLAMTRWLICVKLYRRYSRRRSEQVCATFTSTA